MGPLSLVQLPSCQCHTMTLSSLLLAIKPESSNQAGHSRHTASHVGITAASPTVTAEPPATGRGPGRGRGRGGGGGGGGHPCGRRGDRRRQHTGGADEGPGRLPAPVKGRTGAPRPAETQRNTAAPEHKHRPAPSGTEVGHGVTAQTPLRGENRAGILPLITRKAAV